MKTNKAIFGLIAAAVIANLSARVYGQLASAPDEVLYVQQLPDFNGVIYSAKANGSSVLKIDLMTTQVTVVYQYANGQISTIVYKPIADAASTNASGVPMPTPPATVGYSQPMPVYYPVYYPVIEFRDCDRGHFRGDSHRHWQ